jgi:hypothetical protein
MTLLNPCKKGKTAHNAVHVSMFLARRIFYLPIQSSLFKKPPQLSFHRGFFMKFGQIAFALAMVFMGATAASAGELDSSAPVAPQGVIVRVDASGTREVFKANVTTQVSSDQAAAAAVSQFVSTENAVAKVSPASELDRTSSNEAWYYWYNPSYYSSYYYSYSYSNYSYNYYPCYNWSYGSYSYYFYNWRF